MSHGVFSKVKSVRSKQASPQMQQQSVEYMPSKELVALRAKSKLQSRIAPSKGSFDTDISVIASYCTGFGILLQLFVVSKLVINLERHKTTELFSY